MPSAPPPGSPPPGSSPDARHRALAAAEWLRRVEAEYRSAALTAHLAHWLVQASVPTELVREALRIVDDELVHAELSLAVATEALGSDTRPQPLLERASLGYERRWEPLELDLVASCLETFCLGETVAVPLFRALRAECSVPVARAALDRILADEVRHRDFGWLLLEALLAGPEGQLCRAFANDMLPDMVTRLGASYGALAAETTLPAPLRAWGLMPGSEYAAALALAARRDYRPRLEALGFAPVTLACLDTLEALTPS